MFVDPFSPDAFKLISLTQAINNLPYSPMRIGEMGIFEEQGVSTLDVVIEEKTDGSLQLLTPTPRGGPGLGINPGSRKVHSFRVPHILVQSAVYADEVMNVRQFGYENQQEVLQTRIDEKLTQMRRDIDYYTERARVSALNGSYINVNSSSISLFTEFGVSQQNVAMTFSSTQSSSTRSSAFEILEKIANAMGAVPYTEVRALCSPGFWRYMMEDKDIKDTFLNTQMAASLRGDPRLSMMYNGITFEWYHGTTDCKIADDEAVAFPVGVPGLFISRYAPANYVETVGTIGIPYYVKSEPMAFGKGYSLEAQSNQIHICTRPAALIKLTT